MVAILIGSLGGAISFGSTRIPGFAYQDFAPWYLAAEALASGGDPFAAARVFATGLLYPFPAIALLVPFTLLPIDLAAALFVALTSGILAWVLSSRAWWPLLVFTSGAYIHAAMVAQWAMLLLAGAVSGWAWLVAIKPNMGMAIFGQHLRWRSLAVGLAILAISLVALPDWTRQWVSNTSSSGAHFALWRTGWGVVVQLAWLRWRRPEARLLGVLGLIPISPLAYEQLILFAIPATRRQATLMACTTLIAYMILGMLPGEVSKESFYRIAGPVVLVTGYLPALVMVLRRPNVGVVGPWLEKLSGALPRNLRGGTVDG